MRGKRTIKLQQQFDAEHSRIDKPVVYRYIVKQVTNSTTPTVAAILTKEQVEMLIGDGFDVTVV